MARLPLATTPCKRKNRAEHGQCQLDSIFARKLTDIQCREDAVLVVAVDAELERQRRPLYHALAFLRLDLIAVRTEEDEQFRKSCKPRDGADQPHDVATGRTHRGRCIAGCRVHAATIDFAGHPYNSGNRPWQGRQFKRTHRQTGMRGLVWDRLEGD